MSRIFTFWVGSRRQIKKLFPRFRIFFLVYAIVIALSTGSAKGSPLEAWHWRNPLPQGNELNNVVFANGTHVAVGELGTILTSTDGTNWLRRESGTLDALHDCTYGAGRYVVVGDYGTVLTSTDLVSWTWQYPGTFYSLNGITFAAGQFVAVGEQTTILTSPDGANWTQHASGEWDLYDVIQANGIFVAVGGTVGTANAVSSGIILTSPNASTWTRRMLNSGDPIISIASGAGQFAAVQTSYLYGYGYFEQGIWTSPDGASWQKRPGPHIQAINSIAYGQGFWLLWSHSPNYFNYGYPSNAGILGSVDLDNWSQVASNSTAINGIDFGGSKFVAARGDGTFLNSTNGLDWKNPVGESSDLYFQDLQYVNGKFWGMAGDRIAQSADGTTWTTTILPTNTGSLFSVTYGNGRYVAGSDYHTVRTSTDGLEWTNPAPDLSITPLSDVVVTFGKDLFVGVAGPTGDILTSTNGLDWTVQQLQTNLSNPLYFRDVTFGNGRFVAISEDAIATSSNGTNWLFNPTSYGIRRLAFGNNTFVAVGYNAVLTSSDGTNWLAANPATFGYLSDVAFGGGYFVAVGGNRAYGSTFFEESPIWISADGVHWSSRSSHTYRLLNTIAFGDGTFVIGGEAGLILQSDPLINLTMTMQTVPQLHVSGPANRSYRIECTDNLTSSNQWAMLTTLFASQSPASFADATWTNSTRRFYRAFILP